ncbi:MAG: DUF4253 domain-containing protein [Candidatus Eiseniibacteriota bacterium]
MTYDKIKEEITNYLQSISKPYIVSTIEGYIDTGCVYWELPPQKEEDKPIFLRHSELSIQIIELVKENKNDPRIETLMMKAHELLKGIHTTKKYGMSLVSINDVLRLDQSKGLRKEWVELHSRYKDKEITIFQGYTKEISSLIADILIVMPSKDQYEFLRINQTTGNNHPIETEQIIKSLKKLGDEFDISIVSASADSVEFIFNNPIDSKIINKVRQRLHRLCPSAEELASSIRSGRINLWWD